MVKLDETTKKGYTGMIKVGYNKAHVNSISM